MDIDELFECRYEVADLGEVLNEWLESNPNSDKKDFVEKILSKLEFIHMVW